MANKYLTVSALNKYLFYKFDSDLNLRNVYLKAEISNVRLSKGILYFVLKDNDAEINGLMFQNVLSKINFTPNDGMTVYVNGKVSLYEKRGTYAITVYNMEQAGIGDLYLKFIELKNKLEKEGLFEESHKLKIPKISNYIGVITSGTGDAMHDIFSTIERRFPLAKILFFPAIVQGNDAPSSLIKSIEKANLDGRSNVIIIARGGGSIEDLSCFNDESLARAIYNSKIPIISGVGHEADFTICDFVSSFRAPTPTGAAVAATPNKEDLFNEININEKKLKQYLQQKIFEKEKSLNLISNRYGLKNFKEKFNQLNKEIDKLEKHLDLLSPKRKIEQHETNVNQALSSLKKSYKRILENKDENIQNIIDKLILLNPLNIMSKGYTVVFQDNKIVTRKSSLNDSSFVLKFYDGEIKAKEVKE